MELYKFFTSKYNYLTLIAVPLLFLLILRLLGFDGLYGQDSYEYLRYTNAIQNYIVEGTHPGNYYWPVLYPVFGSLIGFIFGSTPLGLQLISCLSFSTACIYILKSIRLLYPKAPFSFLYVFVFAVFCPFLLKMGLIVMSDATAMAFVVLTFYFFFKSYYKKTSIVPLFVFATCALMTRYASLFITLPIILYSLYLVIKRKSVYQFITAICLSFLVVVPFIIFQWNALFEVTSNYFLKVWSFLNYFKASYTTADGTQSYLLPNLVYTFYVFFHPGFIFIGVLLSLISLKERKYLFSFPQKILCASIGLYVFFLAGIPFQNSRILGLVFPLVLIFLFPAFLSVTKKKYVQKFIIPFTIISIIAQLCFWIATFHQVYSRTLIEKEIVDLLEPYQEHTLYSFDLDLAIKGRGLNFEYKNMFVDLYKNYNTGDLILFDPLRYRFQWKDKNPMLNWEFIEDNYNLKILDTHPKGWKLYKIESKK
ncbi:ArnT family glycosyltransferase [Lacinutrix jangbogonensis]|uniref:ArnT family glycosyltransferase n=1 Tax=Lacinutrix jangbogonensis TaxID=1469557 RepID=UPI00053DC3C7|nr:hypothetical protein [Lacinutrix jangbogonensis]